MTCVTPGAAILWFNKTVVSAPRSLHPDVRCALIAEGQWGLLNLAQARAAGMSRQMITRRLKTGAWKRILPRVYCITGAPASWEQKLMALVLWAGERAAVSHRAAACLWGLPDFTEGVLEIAAARRLSPPDSPRFEHCVVHQVDEHLLPEIVVLRGIPVTSIRRTLLDLSGMKHRFREKALDHSLRLGLTTIAQMALLYEEEWTRGRRGIAILRAMLAERDPGLAPTQSDGEDLMKRIIRDHALPRPLTQYPVVLPTGAVHVDFAYPEAKIAIECDGYAWHMNREAFERDRERDLELQALGWLVLRFTWARLKWEPAYCAGQVEHHLRLREVFRPPTS